MIGSLVKISLKELNICKEDAVNVFIFLNFLPVCQDKRKDCTLVTNAQYCVDNHDLMKELCPKSCGFCTS